jgi:meso-butanediol dehydrogenase/(S,S)-butanediol dehydrogenase/diacetyl reductase
VSGRMQGLTAVVTGAGRGIGRAIALAYAAEGARVVAGARTTAEVEAVAAEIAHAGGEALALTLDVTDDASVAALAEAVLDRVGVPDVLCTNAGAYHADRFTDIPLAVFQHLVDVNYLGVVRSIQAFLPGMLERGSGSLVTVASTAGKYGSAYQTPYNASKHAVVGLIRSLGLELGATGVRVNGIAPGFVETDMIGTATDRFAAILGVDVEQVQQILLQRVPMRRFLQPEEIAHLAVYLGSQESSGMTGQTITISGGLIVV